MGSLIIIAAYSYSCSFSACASGLAGSSVAFGSGDPLMFTLITVNILTGKKGEINVPGVAAPCQIQNETSCGAAFLVGRRRIKQRRAQILRTTYDYLQHRATQPRAANNDGASCVDVFLCTI